MDQLHTRLDALEQQTRTVTRQLRWWRGLAGGLLVLAVLTWALPAVTAHEDARGREKGLAQRVAALEDLLKHFSRKGNEVVITGANLRLVNGLGSTDCFDEEQGEEIPDCPNGLGNLIVGYNEPRALSSGEDIRTGSHNVVVGEQHNFSRVGGLVVGAFNTISGDFASVSGGSGNTASGFHAVVSGGSSNTASGDEAAVSGGIGNTASGERAAVSGGTLNTASGFGAVVSGGGGDTDRWIPGNTASGDLAVVSGGSGNTASGHFAVISGGGRVPSGSEIPGNTASGVFAVVSGGAGNTASGAWSVVSGGLNRTAEGDFDWVAGSLFEDE